MFSICYPLASNVTSDAPPRGVGNARGKRRTLTPGLRRHACRLVLAFTLTLSSGMAAGAPQQTPDADTIARNVDYVNRFNALRNVSYGTDKQPVVVFDHTPGERIVANTFRRWRTNDVSDEGVAARDLVVFRGGKLDGTGILVADPVDPARTRTYIMWLPELRKARRMLEPDAADHWGNSNFSYGDIYLRRPEDEDHEVLGRENFSGCLGAVAQAVAQGDRRLAGLPEADCSVDGRQVYRVRSRPHRDDLGYDERIVLIDAESFADYRSTFFAGGVLIKTIDKSWRGMRMDDPRARHWRYWYARTEATGQEGMAFVPDGAVSWNDDIEPRFWSESTLRRMSR